MAGPTFDEHALMAFCGPCKHFEPWGLGGGGDCRKGHDTEARTAADECPDRDLYARLSGPQFDMSE